MKSHPSILNDRFQSQELFFYSYLSNVIKHRFPLSVVFSKSVYENVSSLESFGRKHFAIVKKNIVNKFEEYVETKRVFLLYLEETSRPIKPQLFIYVIPNSLASLHVIALYKTVLCAFKN